MNPTHNYTAADVERWLGKKEVGKGEGYLDAVSGLDVQADAISADVQGTARRPYRVGIRFYADKRGAWQVDSQCTCPVASGCKHGAAVLLTALAQRD
jgi:uncharacterized Zn finger protein